jgi:hypothetical protein
MARLKGTVSAPSARTANNQKSPPTTGFSSADTKRLIVRKEMTIDKNSAAKAASKYRVIVMNQNDMALV